MKKDIKAALGASLKTKKQTIKNRFAKAEAVLDKRTASATWQQEEPVSRVIRDSFTMPADDYELLSAIKKRCLKLAIAVNKSEVLRAGLNALNGMSDKQLRTAMNRIERVKTDRA